MNDDMATWIKDKQQRLEDLTARRNSLIAVINEPLSEINTLSGQIAEINRDLNFYAASQAAKAKEPVSTPVEQDVAEEAVSATDTQSQKKPLIPLNRKQLRKQRAIAKNGHAAEPLPAKTAE